MEILKQDVLKRKNDLEQQRSQFIANANACEGAIQDCEFWLQQLERVEQKDKETAKLQKVE